MTNSHWSYVNPVEVNFGAGARNKLLDACLGKNCLVVTSERGRKQIAEDDLLRALDAREQCIWASNIKPNPDIEDLNQLIIELRDRSIETVIGFGGGSAIDAAKVIATGLNPEFADLHLEQIIGHPRLNETKNKLELYAVPTTSGTGSEVTPFATVWNHTTKKKLSLAGRIVFPTAAFVDPELTLSLPINSTLDTGLDAINQAAESIWNNNASPITLGYATRALRFGIKSLPGLVVNPKDLRLRTDMAEASLLSGLAISHTRTALCHSISYPLTAHFGIPHGLACAFTMPAVLKFNLEADDGRFVTLARELETEDILGLFESLNEELRVRSRIKDYVPALGALLELIPEMYTPGRADNNLRAVSETEIKMILKASFGH